MKANFDSMYFIARLHMVAGSLCGWGSGSGRAFDIWGRGWGVVVSLQIVDLHRLASLLTMMDNCDNFNFDLYMNN